MLSTVLIVVLILAVGTNVADRVRLKQEQAILEKLPVADAKEYYDVLRRRARRVQVLRAIALVSLVTAFYLYKHRIAPAPEGRSAPALISR